MSYNATLVTGNKATATATYAEEEVLMPKAGRRGEVPALIGIDIYHPQMGKLDDKISQWQLSTEENDAMGNLDDKNNVAFGQRDGQLDTNGRVIEDRVERIVFPAPIPITFDKLFIGFYQDSGGSFTYRYRLWFAPRYIPGVQQKANVTTQTQF